MNKTIEYLLNEFKTKAILAPMSGYSDIAFRILCKKYNCALTCTEFVSANAVIETNKKTLSLIKTDQTEKPNIVQIFGNDENKILEAAKILKNKFDIIDINFGCPAPKITKNKAGSELLKDPKKIKIILETLISNINKPITAKIRIGIDETNINVHEISKLIEKTGVEWITIHGRTQKQGYSGKSNWKIIQKIKEKSNIPIIGNGDVSSPEEFKEHLENTKVDGIMIGRASLGNPYLFQQIYDYMTSGSYETKDKLEQFEEYLELAIKYKISFNDIKSQAMYFTKGSNGGSELRSKIAKTKNLDELKLIFKF